MKIRISINASGSDGVYDNEIDELEDGSEDPEDDPDDEDEEDPDEEEEEADGPPDWDSYADYPYAMETVNGTILSMHAWVQEKALLNTLDKFGVTLDRLAEYLRSRSDTWEDDDEEEDEDDLEFLTGELFGRDDEDSSDDDFTDLKELDCFDFETLYEMYGFDEDSGTFDPGGMGFMDSRNGFEMNDILERLGFSLESDIYEGPHGHDSSGVYFIPPEE